MRNRDLIIVERMSLIYMYKTALEDENFVEIGMQITSLTIELQDKNKAILAVYSSSETSSTKLTTLVVGY
ncbi:unnamed protein product, partial [Nesidiocoris tenuis]